MKGTLHKAEQGWIVIYDEVVGENIVKKNQNALSLVDNGHIDGLKLYDSNEGLEVEFEIVSNEGEPLGKGEQPYTQYAKLAKITTPEEDKMVTKCYCGHTSYCDCGPLPEEADLKDWDVTLNDGLENEVWDEKLIKDLINETVPEPFATPEELQAKPYVSDDFQIGPDGAYEHIEDMTPREKAKSELINLLLYQIMDLTTMSKIELGDDVIAKIRQLNEIIKIGEQEIEKIKL